MDLQWLADAWKWLTEALSGDIDWGSRIPAYVGLALSVLALWRGRSSVRVFLGCGHKADLIIVSNLSPHAIEITSVGVIEANGDLSDWFDGPDAWPGLPKRLEPRSECTITLPDAIAPFSAYQRKYLGRCGCFVRVAGGREFSDPGRLRRRWWWVRSLLERLLGRLPRRPAED